jgi:positive regulator of sigma E activity
MTPSIFIARILGPVLVIIGLGLLVEGETFRVMAGDFLRSSALIYFSGVTTLAIGLAILNFHHLWVRDWRVLVTMFGWLFLIGGIVRLLATSWVQRVGESLIAHQRWPIASAVVILAIGAFLSLKGYQDVWDVGRRASSHRSSAAKSSGSTASRSAKRPRRKAS